jgi:hypothetical protein
MNDTPNETHMAVNEVLEELVRREEQQTPKALRLNLLENGLDFIREGVESLYGDHRARPEPKAYKYALLHIFSGTLLVLKERLRRAHPSLIFQKVAESGKAAAKTVDFDEVINRLEGAVAVKLDHADRALLRDVQAKRNALEHFEANLELDEVNSSVGGLVDFLERFLHDELEESLLRHVSGAAARELKDLQGIAQRLRERHAAEWSERIKPYRKISRRKLAELAEQGEYHPKHNPDARLYECPQCSEESVAIAERDIGICTAWECREIVMIEDCERCGGGIVLPGEAFCADCTSYMQYQMDQD